MRKFFSDLKDKFDEERNRKDGKVSPKPSPQAGATPSTSVDGLTNVMGGMTLDHRPQAGSSSSGSGFIGGFA